ncbi:MAG TPA: nucleotidyltransferase [Hanamia sp.]|nr:nucleotidyltransferase [Hanamia sp.]
MKKMINLERDIIEFIELCNKHEVKYLIIGGYAVSVHGYPRSTKDIDVCIEMSERNAAKMVRVINDFGFSSLKLNKEDFLKRDLIMQLGFPPLRIDILNDLDGVPFEEAWQNKKIVSLENVPVNFIGYNELIIVKQKAGRPQDIADVDKLTKKNKRNK